MTARVIVSCDADWNGDDHRAALDLVQAVHDALTGLGLVPWVRVPAGTFVRDEWGALRAPERRRTT